MEAHLISPTNRVTLRPRGTNLLTDGERLWPVVDGIPYLREGELAERAAEHLRHDRVDAARRLLLTDRDRFAPGDPAQPGALDPLFGANATLRSAMQTLGYGPVGDYFAHRWTSPTYLTGVRLLERTVCAGRPVIEVACGIGHFLRLLEQRAVPTIGIDIVYSKLWLARRFLGVRGQLVCGDIERSPVVRLGGTETERSATVFCHDAFYFFERKAAALRHLRSLAGPVGRLAVGHVHTRQDRHEAGFALSVEDYQALADAPVYGEGACVRPAAVYWVEGGTNARLFPLEEENADLRLNPLLSRHGVRWPSEGWRREYEADCRRNGIDPLQDVWEPVSCADLLENDSFTTLDAIRRSTLWERRILLNLPEKW